MRKRTTKRIINGVVDTLLTTLLHDEPENEDESWPTLHELLERVTCSVMTEVRHQADRVITTLQGTPGYDLEDKVKRAVHGAFAMPGGLVTEIQGLRHELANARGQRAQALTTEAEVGVMKGRIHDLQTQLETARATKKVADTAREAERDRADALHRALYALAQRMGGVILSPDASRYLPGGKGHFADEVNRQPGNVNERDRAIVTDAVRMAKMCDARLVELLAREKVYLEKHDAAASINEEPS